ncbi:MAG: tRNA-dihydrouridine synthase, partial [Proteobacteria bacterium]|nr:tRNA-dihydrouridine synthase [Pseudomonadota bacterium]
IFEKTNCAGVMIARASVGQPWLFQKLYSESNKKTFEEPEVEHVGKIFLEHIEQLQSFENEKLAVLQSRKLAKYYARKIKDPINFVSEIQSAKNIKTIADLTKKYFSQNPT